MSQSHSPDIEFKITVGDAASALPVLAAADLKNKAYELEKSGDLAGAEKKHLEALAIKIKVTGNDSIDVALIKNVLGELYMKMEGRLDDAQKMLEDAAKIRSVKPNFDTVCTWDNLGQLWEMRGDLVKAREAREMGKPDMMTCSNFNCPLASVWKLQKISEMKHCKRCKSTFYCSRECQKVDWKVRHKSYCKETA